MSFFDELPPAMTQFDFGMFAPDWAKKKTYNNTKKKETGSTKSLSCYAFWFAYILMYVKK